MVFLGFRWSRDISVGLLGIFIVIDRNFVFFQETIAVVLVLVAVVIGTDIIGPFFFPVCVFKRRHAASLMPRAMVARVLFPDEPVG